MRRDYETADMRGLNLNHLLNLAKLGVGRYIVYIDDKVMREVEVFFDYDCYRNPPHPHFLEWGSSRFSKEYLLHYLFCGNKKYDHWISQSHERHGYTIHLEVKEG